jgi:CheY-like chemotaxis protein
MKGEPLIVLLVEDNLDHTDLIMENLAHHRVANRVVHVPDGEAALNYLWRRGPYAEPMHSPRPHLILLDLRLPKIDGLEVLEEIKNAEHLRQIPVVIVTTSDAERDVTQAYHRHANSYLVKPVDFDQFTRLMDDLGFYWLAWNRHPGW